MGMGDDGGGGKCDVVYRGSAEPMLVSPIRTPITKSR